MAVLAGKLEARREDCAPIAGKSTLNRLELSKLASTRYHKMQVTIRWRSGRCWSTCSWRRMCGLPNRSFSISMRRMIRCTASRRAIFPRLLRLLLLSVPLYVFCERHLLLAKLRRSALDAADGAVEEMARIVAQIRRRWPRVRILVRANSGFARDDLMAWCEANGVDFLFGFKRDERLVAEIAAELDLAAAKSRRTGRPERRFKSFMWMTRRSWSRRRRVVAKAEWTQGEANPRFVITSLRRDECKAKYLYEKVYCARGEMENRIKECQLNIYADRTSAATMLANRVAPVVLLDGLCPAVCSAPYRAPRYRLRPGHLRHHPAQAAQDRRARAHQRPPHQVRHGVRLSGRARLGPRWQSGSQSPPWPAPRRHDTPRRGAIIARQNPQAHRDPENMQLQNRTLRRHGFASPEPQPQSKSAYTPHNPSVV